MSETTPGMGAIPGDEGSTFRVWAPHADSVAVCGSFNEWDEVALDPEGDGYWAVHVPDAAPGDEYRFTVRAGGEEWSRLDPYALEVTNSVGNAVIRRRDDFDWLVPDDYRTPPRQRA